MTRVTSVCGVAFPSDPPLAFIWRSPAPSLSRQTGEPQCFHLVAWRVPARATTRMTAGRGQCQRSRSEEPAAAGRSPRVGGM